MLNIPTSIKNLFNSDRCRKNFRVRFPNGELPDITNKDVVQESMRFTESLCSRDVLKFGLTESSVMEFETVGVGNMYGLMIEAFCEVDTSSLSSAEISSIQSGTWDGEFIPAAASDIGYSFFRIPYGVFRVESCPRNSDIVPHRKVTAYSLSYSRLSKALPGFPINMPFYSMHFDPAAFYAQTTGEGLIPTEREFTEGWFYSSDYLYDANRNYYHLSHDGMLACFFNRSADIAQGKTTEADFVKIDGSWDAAAYEAVGISIAEELNRLNLDLTYDTKKKKIYNSNLDALRDKLPELFSPVIQTYARKPAGASTYAYYSPIFQQNLVTGQLIPLVRDYPDAAFTPGSDKLFHQIDSEFVCLLPRAAGETFVIYKNDDVAGTIKVSTIPEVEIQGITQYRMERLESNKLWVVNTGQASIPLTVHRQISDTGSFTHENLPRYSYVDAYDREALLDGYLELNAMFGKVNRLGKLQGLRLSTENPVSVNSSQYSDFWWDEYDVQPIGSVLYSFEDAQEGAQELEYRFGDGASVYDMTDNAVLKSLDSTTAETVQQLIDENFVPHLLPVAFTPIELSMQGHPYMEDGDYLAVTAADGTVARSFNMRHEISGIQALEAEITSVSGEIIDSDTEVFG